METPFTSLLDTICQNQPNNHPTTRICILAYQKGGPHLLSLSPLSLFLRAIRAWRGGLQLLSSLLQQLAAKWQANDESPHGMTPEQYSLCSLMCKGIMNDVGQALRPPSWHKTQTLNITICITSNPSKNTCRRICFSETMVLSCIDRDTKLHSNLSAYLAWTMTQS